MSWVARGPQIMDPPADLPSLVGKLMHARGFKDSVEILEFLSPSLKSLKHPHSLLNMEKAIHRLWEAFVKEEPVCIYADFDLDGTSGLALLLKGLEKLGFENLSYYQPSRLSEGYGVHLHAIEELAEKGVKVLITVDVGITAVEPLRRAKELGMDVILTDHHLPGSELPDAFAVINPNQSECEAGLGHLCGAGVAYYLFLALKVEFTKKGVITSQLDSKDLLDCFVIGTLTDMVPLKEENRVLSRHGLKSLEETSRPGLRALMEALGLKGRPLSSSDVAIRLAPKLNALSRMENGLRPIDLFVESSFEKAKSLVEEVLACNEQRRGLQGQAQEMAQEMALAQKEQGFIWVYSREFHRGIVGLVATRLVQDFGVPAFVGSMDDSGVIVGSARAPQGYHLLEIFKAAGAALDRSGGHAQAAGFELKQSEVDHFHTLVRGFIEKLRFQEKEMDQYFDVEARLEEINTGFMSWMEHMEPFGQGFESPSIKVPNLQVKAFKELRGGHLKLEVAHPGSTYQLQALYFSPPKSLLETLRQGMQIEILCEPQWNYFAGRKSLQLLVQALRLL